MIPTGLVRVSCGALSLPVQLISLSVHDIILWPRVKQPPALLAGLAGSVGLGELVEGLVQVPVNLESLL